MAAGRARLVESQVITRPVAEHAAYTAADLVANHATAGSVTPFLFEGVVRQAGYKTKVKRASLAVSGTAVTNGAFKVHLFTAAPTVTNGDNAAFGVATNADKYVGQIAVSLQVGGAAGSKGWSSTAAPDLSFISTTSKNLWGLLEATGAYDPVAGETFKIGLEVE